MIQNLSYLMLSTNNREQLVNFYHKILGMELKNPDDPISTLSFPNGGVSIGFLQKDDSLGENKRVELTFYVESVRKAVDHYTKKGVEFWRGFTKVAEGLHVANFRDPDGNEISLLSFGEK